MTAGVTHLNPDDLHQNPFDSQAVAVTAADSATDSTGALEGRR